MNSIIDGSAKRSDDLISRLHAIIRPFVLRRLKKDVETQMPGKFEHIVKCPMSRRQVSFSAVDFEDSATHVANLLLCADVSVRGVHGPLINTECVEEGWKLHGHDERPDAAQKGLQPSGFV